METDPTLRAVERNTWLVLAALTGGALFVPPRPAVALGVLGGGLLVWVSYWSLKRGVSAFVAMAVAGGEARADRRRAAVRELRQLVLRYALLALLAYVMISRLRAHPWGLLAGASSVLAGVTIEAVRLLWKK